MGVIYKTDGKFVLGGLDVDELDCSSAALTNLTVTNLTLPSSGTVKGERIEAACAMSVTADVVNRYFYIASEDTIVKKIKEIHGTAETTSTGTYLQVERLQGTESLGAGDDLLASSAPFDLKGTADTLQTGTVVESTAVYLSEGDRLAVNIDGATTEIASVIVQVELDTQ